MYGQKCPVDVVEMNEREQSTWLIDESLPYLQIFFPYFPSTNQLQIFFLFFFFWRKSLNCFVSIKNACASLPSSYNYYVRTIIVLLFFLLLYNNAFRTCYVLKWRITSLFLFCFIIYFYEVIIWFFWHKITVLLFEFYKSHFVSKVCLQQSNKHTLGFFALESVIF